MNLQFKNVTPEVFEKLKKVMGNIGVEIEGDQGDIAAQGIKGSFNRDPESGMLEIEIKKTPFILPKSMLANQIKNMVTNSGGEVVDV